MVADACKDSHGPSHIQEPLIPANLDSFIDVLRMARTALVRGALNSARESNRLYIGSRIVLFICTEVCRLDEPSWLSSAPSSYRASNAGGPAYDAAQRRQTRVSSSGPCGSYPAAQFLARDHHLGAWLPAGCNVGERRAAD